MTLQDLATYAVDALEVEKLTLKEHIGAALKRLEGLQLIAREADRYAFLTRWEQEIQREIGLGLIEEDKVAREIGRIIFDEVLLLKGRFRYQPAKLDFKIDQKCDDYEYRRGGQELGIWVITPFAAAYQDFSYERCLTTAAKQDVVLVKLSENNLLESEALLWLRISAYLEKKHLWQTGRGQARHSKDDTQAYLELLSRQNCERRERIAGLLRMILPEAEIFIKGKKWQPKGSGQSKGMIEEALEYLIANAFTKLSYIQPLSADPKGELAQGLSELESAARAEKPQAAEELQALLTLLAHQGETPTLEWLVSRYSGKPYGWPIWEAVLLIANLAASKKIVLTSNGGPLTSKVLSRLLLERDEWPTVVVKASTVLSPVLVLKAKKIARRMLQAEAPAEQEMLAEIVCRQLPVLRGEILGFLTRVLDKGYPGAEILERGLKLVDRLLACAGSGALLSEIAAAEAEIFEFSSDYEDVSQFLKTQFRSWEELLALRARAAINLEYWKTQTEVWKVITRTDEILKDAKPFGQLKEALGLSKSFFELETKVLREKTDAVTAGLDKAMARLKEIVVQREILDQTRVTSALALFDDLKAKAQGSRSLDFLENLAGQVDRLLAQQAFELKNSGADGQAYFDFALFDPAVFLEPGELLKTHQDVKAYLEKLEKSLLKAVAEGPVRLK